MEYVVLGWPPDGPTLRLDYRRFAYAGKFVTSATGKAIVRDPEARDSQSEYDQDVLAAVSFSPDRETGEVLWLRYVTVRDDRRGEGFGPRLCRLAVARGREHGFDEARIAVNNPFAFEALYRAGFSWTRTEAGLAELVLSTGASRSGERYRAGLDAFRGRDLSDAEEAFLASRTDGDPPELVPVPDG